MKPEEALKDILEACKVTDEKDADWLADLLMEVHLDGFQAGKKQERERCLKVMHEAYVNHRGASVQIAFPEDAKILLSNMARVLKEIEDEIRNSSDSRDAKS